MSWTYSTNTTSTSAWSLSYSWMQYITLTLPCLDPGRQGPEREEHTGWAVAESQGSRSLNLTVVCKKESRWEDCIVFFVCVSNCLHIVKQLKSRGIRRRHFKRFEMIISYFKNKDHFLWLFFFLKQCAYLSQRVRKPESTHLNSLTLSWIHGDVDQSRWVH